MPLAGKGKAQKLGLSRQIVQVEDFIDEDCCSIPVHVLNHVLVSVSFAKSLLADGTVLVLYELCVLWQLWIAMRFAPLVRVTCGMEAVNDVNNACLRALCHFLFLVLQQYLNL